MKRKFHGPWIVLAAFITFGLSTGLPYYNISFFYDYFNRDFGWSREQITLGFPLAVALTIWTGPLLIHRFSPRRLILVGTFLTFCALAGFGLMPGRLSVYYLLWVIYTVGYFLSGPPPHQFIISNWYRRNRGKAMAVVYVGVGVIGSLGSFLAKPLTEWFGYHMALVILGLMLFLAWPLVIFIMKDHPREMGQNPDGDPEPPAEQAIRPQSFRWLLARPAFWLLLVGSVCSIGSIGAVNFHMKFVFLDQGFQPGTHLAGGLVREGDGQDVPGGGVAGLDQVTHPVGEHAGLAAARTGDDQHRARHRGDGPDLLLVEPGQDIPLPGLALHHRQHCPPVLCQSDSTPASGDRRERDSTRQATARELRAGRQATGCCQTGR